MNSGYFQVRGNIICGVGKAGEIGKEVKKSGFSRVMVVTDKFLRNAGVLATAFSSLENEGITYEVYDAVQADPSVILMDDIAAHTKEYRAEALIGIGGGSALDSAKGAAIVVTNGGSIRDYVGEKKFSIPPLPVFALPTTAGTGSEVTWHISVNDTERELKVTVRSPLCVPEVAILDASLMTTVPKRVAAYTGMDAFTHSFESYISTNGAWDFTETLGLRSMELIAQNLRPFAANPNNLEAGEKMLIASMLGGMCLSHARTGIVHQMARPLGALFHVSHGLANSMLLPHAMAYTVQGNPEKFAKVAQIMGVNTTGMTTMEKARAAISAVEELNRDIGLPSRLREVGVTEDKIPQLAHDAMQGKDVFTNPCRGKVEDLIDIYKAAF